MTTSQVPPRVAVVGAGMGGAFFSDALANLTAAAGRPPPSIDIYEAGSEAGGRALSLHGVEVGASMIIKQVCTPSYALSALPNNTSRR